MSAKSPPSQIHRHFIAFLLFKFFLKFSCCRPNRVHYGSCPSVCLSVRAPTRNGTKQKTKIRMKDFHDTSYRAKVTGLIMFSSDDQSSEARQHIDIYLL